MSWNYRVIKTNDTQLKNQVLYDYSLVKAWRLYKKVSAQYVAAYLEIDIETYIEIEQGNAVLNDDLKHRLATLLNIIPAQLEEEE